MQSSPSLPSQMRFIDFTAPAQARDLRLSQRPLPQPAEHEVLIQVHYAGINRPDLSQREGKYPPPTGASPILGLEVSGVIAATGSSSQWKVGDSVCALVPGGGYAEYCLAPDVQCLPIPKGLTLEAAAGIPEAFFTVWANVFQIGQLKAGERFLVHGGTSGIGTTAIQLARAFGCEVYTTVGSDQKCEAVRMLGATPIHYKKQDFAVELKRLTASEGVHVILDMIGGPYTPKNIQCLAQGGRLVQIATLQGAETQINLVQIMQKRITLTGSTLRPRSIVEKGQIARELYEKVWPLLESKKIQVLIDRVFDFSTITDAHLYMESSQHIGKIILKVS